MDVNYAVVRAQRWIRVIGLPLRHHIVFQCEVSVEGRPDGHIAPASRWLSMSTVRTTSYLATKTATKLPPAPAADA